MQKKAFLVALSMMPAALAMMFMNLTNVYAADVYDQMNSLYNSQQAANAQNSIMSFLSGPLIIVFRILFAAGIILCVLVVGFAFLRTWHSLRGKGQGWDANFAKVFIGGIVVAALLTSGSWIALLKTTQNLAVNPLTKIITEPAEQATQQSTQK